MNNNKVYDGLSLFSGGLDSILAAKIVEKQGLKLKCLHFTTSFFGFEHLIDHWKNIYNLDIEAVDISKEYAEMLANFPRYGFGSTLNPCVDCKILMMRKTRELLAKYNGKFIVSGEVLGQRPMSQRRDTLNVIRRDAGIKNILLRPLCALHLEPTEAELSGLIDRSQLLGFSGRGRNPQLELAKSLGIEEIPTPAGGCKLTEKENAARFWHVLHFHNPTAKNFTLASVGRQFWHSIYKNIWLIIGRNKEDNDKIAFLQEENDIILRINNFPSPLALIRPKKNISSDMKTEILQEAGALLASYSPKAKVFSDLGNQIEILMEENEQKCSFFVNPERFSKFSEPAWEICQPQVKSWTKIMNSNYSE